jgi:hypothetical protein
MAISDPYAVYYAIYFYIFNLSENAVIPHPSTGWGCKAVKN